MKRLLLCRHAKSSWKDLTLSDIDRPLNRRGKKDAPEMGKRLAALGIRPDMIVSSPACRALATARKMAGALGFGRKNITIIEEVYGATVEELLDVIQGLDDAADLVLIVGHNSETTVLANILGNLDIDNIPTCGVVSLDFSVRSWRKIGPGQGALVFFAYPRKGGMERPA
jgi:phosphohistidine phosphatase